MSNETAVSLGVVDIRVNTIETGDQVAQKFPSVFQGIGKLKNFEVKLHIDQSVPPVAQSARRIPFHLRNKVEAELDRLEEQGIIQKVDGPTPWISPLVGISKKNEEIRLCVDMRMANRAILRERHYSCPKWSLKIGLSPAITCPRKQIYYHFFDTQGVSAHH